MHLDIFQLFKNQESKTLNFKVVINLRI